MKAFHNDPLVKEKYLTRVQAHKAADEIIKGKYWEDGKGCAVGCTIHSSNHAKYETELGIPEWLARMEDTIFEGLPNEKAKEWPEKFLAAITPGQDLENIKGPFLIFVLEFTLDKFDNVKFPDVKKAIDTVIELYRTEERDLDKFAEAAWAAEAAAWAAEAAWASAAAWAAARAAARAAWASEAARAAWASEAAWAARAATYEKFADKLLEIIRNKVQ